MSTRELDVLTVPMNGAQLIEASAGTGKTYAITNLFVRLIAEGGFSVDRILVLTFTRAATAELRERIEQRLREVAEVLDRDAGSLDDAFVSALIARTIDRRELRRRVEMAIVGFDAAAVYTIHGFCQRALGDNALLSSTAMNAEMLNDDSELRVQIARDFWRRELHGVSRLFAEYLLANEGKDPAALLRRFGLYLGKPYLRLLGGSDDIDCEPVEQGYISAFAAAVKSWTASRDEVAEILLNSAALNRNRYRKNTVAGWIAVLDRLLRNDAVTTMWLPDWMEKLTPRWMADKINSGARCPEHEFFNLSDALLRRRDDLQQCFGKQALRFRRRFIEYCNNEMPRRQRLVGAQSFDDVLNNLAVALHGDNALQLAARIRQQYGAALIDEFQDTDPVQYDILHRIYSGSDCPVYFVGDPKQAIYAFRGADVFAYIAARNEVAVGPTSLSVNWRSTPQLVAAVNKIFSAAPTPFLVDEITFSPATAASRPQTDFRLGDDGAAFVFWTLPRPAAEDVLNKGDAAALSVRATAMEIARILAASAAGRAGVVDGVGIARPVRGSDCAVLVRTHAQGQLMRRALAAVGIDSVELADSSVFESSEATALTHVLRAIETPANETLVRTALTTPIFGMSGTELYTLMQDETLWEQMLLRFGDYQQHWHNSGFFVMFQRLMDAEAVGQRLLAYGDGPRRMTNLLQLIELLHAESVQGRRGMSQLIEWLVEKRFHRNGRDDAELLRLESDEELVQILTVHRSKGLEYPIVFCPFLWDDGGADRDGNAPIFYHDKDEQYSATLDLSGANEQARTIATVEARAEALRVLYVALTRARNRCYAVWGSAKGAEHAALAWLLHQHRHTADDGLGVVKWLADASEAEVRADIEELGEENIAVRCLPMFGEAVADIAPVRVSKLAARPFRGRIAAPWRLFSYSGLVRQIADDVPDYDEAAATAVEAETNVGGMFAFPRGPHAGSCLHAILERVDFASTNHSSWDHTVDTLLREHGYSTQWSATVRQMIADLVDAPLNVNGLNLSKATLEMRINEMEFHYPVHRFDTRELSAVVRSCSPNDHGLLSQLQRMEAEQLRGYMKGFIDLVAVIDERWYIVDYKSNWLGAHPDDYAPKYLDETIVNEAYGLQYLIYTLALHRYLKQRLPSYSYECHFGGVYYLFLRAVSPRNGMAGVYFDRPAFKLISALDEYFHARGDT